MPPIKQRPREERLKLSRLLWSCWVDLQRYQAWREACGDKRLGPPDPLKAGKHLMRNGIMLAQTGPLYRD